MFIKLSIVIFVFTPSLVIDANDFVMEKPIVESVTRGGRKLFGFFAVQTSPLQYFINKNKSWRGQLFLNFGPHKVIATSVEFHHAYKRDPLCLFCLQHPQQFNNLVNHNGQHPEPNFESNNVDGGFGQLPDTASTAVHYDAPLNSLSSSSAQLNAKPSTLSATAITSFSTNAETTTQKSSSSMEKTLRTLKLEDYDVITFDPLDDDSDESENALNRVRRASEDSTKQESNDETESTTIESSTMHTTIMAEEKEDSSTNHVVTVSPILELPQNPAQDFTTHSATTTTMAAAVMPTNLYDKHNQLYPPSNNAYAQYVSITHRPTSSYAAPVPIKNYYDFYPSQPDLLYHRNDYYQNFVPRCVANYLKHKFAPISYGASDLPLSYYLDHQQKQQNYQIRK